MKRERHLYGILLEIIPYLSPILAEFCKVDPVLKVLTTIFNKHFSQTIKNDNFHLYSAQNI